MLAPHDTRTHHDHAAAAAAVAVVVAVAVVAAAVAAVVAAVGNWMAPAPAAQDLAYVRLRSCTDRAAESARPPLLAVRFEGGGGRGGDCRARDLWFDCR